MPLVEESEDVFGGQGAGGLEFAAFLAEEELAIGIEDGDSGDAAIERDIVFFGDIEIFVHLSDVDIHDEEGLVEGGSNFGALEGFVEDVAIEAPVAAKDHEDAFVGSGGGAQGSRDFGAGIGIGGKEILIHKRLTEAGGGGTLGNAEKPQIILMEPALSHSDVLFFESGAVPESEGEFENHNVQAGLGVVFLGDLPGKIGEALGLQACPEDKFILEGELLVVRADGLRRGRLAVESGDGGGVSGENGGAPLIERRRRGERGSLPGGGGGNEEKREKENRQATHDFKENNTKREMVGLSELGW